MSNETTTEARRQIEICNACRYCEGYCSVFPAITSSRAFSDGDITHLANLCHNCRGCYYACQYTAPHEFDLNLPKILAEVRHDSWVQHSYPQALGSVINTSGMGIAALFVFSLTAVFYAIMHFDLGHGDRFYAYMSHSVMVAIFMPAFLFPLVAMGISLTRYWRSIGSPVVTLRDFAAAITSAGKLKNLTGGHGDGCNFENEDAFTPWRKYFHHFTLYGFLLCFASTSSATLMHYILDMSAPYGPFSLPKILGVPGGIMLCIGTAGLAVLKTKADPNLGAAKVWAGEMAFIVLLFAVSASGLALYWLGDSDLIDVLLPLHLAVVFTLFLMMPYSKMVHGFYRLAALTRDAADVRLKSVK